MRREVRGSWCVLVGAMVLGSGCGSELPPRPVLKPSVAEDPAPEGGAKSIFMVIPGPPDEDVELWGIAGQREAGESRAVFRVIGPGANLPGVDQPSVVRKAVADGASALVVVAGDSPGLPAALAEAEAAKVPVVLIGKPIDPPAGSPPFTQVRPGSFDPAARKVVEAMMADARTLGISETGGAIVLIDKGGDLYSAGRVAALKGAAEAAGIKKVTLAPFDRGGDKVKLALLDALKVNPEAAIVLCDDDEGILSASRTRIDLDRKPTILVGGFAGTRGFWDPNYFANESCFVECRSEQLAKLAVWTALARAKGEKVEAVVELEPKFNRGRGASESAWRAPRSPIAPPQQVETEANKPGTGVR